MEDSAVREHVAVVEQRLAAVEDDPAALQAVAAILDLYGEGLRRLLDGADPTTDELVSHLLVMHGLHPLSTEERVGQALDEVRPYLGSHGGGVETVGITDGVLHLRLEGTCNGCPSSEATMRLAIEEAVSRAAPEIERVEAEGAVPEEPQLLQIRRRLPSAQPSANGVEPAWQPVGSMTDLTSTGPTLRQISSTPVLLVPLDQNLYAYHHACPACGESLELAALSDGELECPGCRLHFDARRAGRCLDSPTLALEPLPLLVGESGEVKVAVG